MAEYTQAEKLNIVLKLVFGIQGTSNTDDSLGLKWYEEIYPWLFYVRNEEIYVDTVPTASDRATADTNASTYSFITKYAFGTNPIKLTEIDRTNGRGWAAYINPADHSAGIIGDWLQPQIFGTGYAMRLFQDDGTGTGPGTEITTTEGAWVPAYKLGAVVMGENRTPSDMGWQTPLWAEVYRYEGDKGISGSTAGVTLDNAYNSSTSESKIFTIDDGSIEFNASNSYAPIQISEISYAPSSDLAGGQIANINGGLYFYDSTRSKWLSIDRQTISYQTRNGDAIYLSTGYQSDINAGYLAAKNGTILAIAANGGSGNQTKEFDIQLNGVSQSTFSLTAGKYTNDTLDIDFSAGDNIQIYCSATGTPIKNARVNVMIAWRES